MAEYQYCELRTVHRRLDAAAQSELRRLSMDARITSRSFVDICEWGDDFAGDPLRWVERWFDLGVYWANWGTRRLMIRLPRRIGDAVFLEPYRVEDGLEIARVGDLAIVEFRSSIEDSLYDRPDERRSVCRPLVPLRSELLRGDRRCLYLGWLLAVQGGLVDDDTPEPPPPPGLARLSNALNAFADFFDLDPNLIAAATTGSEAGQGAPCERPRRTAGELMAAADRLWDEQERLEAEREAAEQARRAEQERIAQQPRLDALAKREDEAWREVDSLAEAKLPKPYDQATALLKDLKALAEREGRPAEFQRRIESLCERHRPKRTLLGRIAKAGLI